MSRILYKAISYVIVAIIAAITLSPLPESVMIEQIAPVDYYEKDFFVSAEEKAPSSKTNHIDHTQSYQTGNPGEFDVHSVVKKGDIAFCDYRPWLPFYNDDSNFSNDHVSLYEGNNRFIEATVIYPWIYKGSKGWDVIKVGVLNTGFAFLNLWATNIIFGTVRNASASQRNTAVNWVETQIRQPYQFTFPPRWPFHIHEWWACSNPNGSVYNPDTGEYFIEKYPDYWYCTELVWAAYKHCNGDSGMDIGARWEYDEKDGSWHWCVTPKYLLGNYEQIYLYTDGDYGNPGTGKPNVESYDVDVGTTSATIYGKLLDDGNERCHCYISLIGEGNNYCRFVKRTTTETFSKLITHLEPGTTYQWYAWAYNSFGEAYGEIMSFTTLESK